MITERRPMLGNNENSFGDEFEKEIGLLLREQRRQDADDREKELNIYRSGSAPPTIEGSLNAVGGLFNNHGGVGGGGGGGGGGGLPFSEFGQNGNGFMSEEELRSDPAYLSYYYSNVNLNPRLPPPLISKEDWRFAQRFQGGSSAIGDRRKGNKNESGSGGRSLFSMPPGFNPKKQEPENESDRVQGSVEWGGDGLIGLPGFGLGNKQKSIADIFQDDLSLSTPVIGHPSRPSSRNAFDENVDTFTSAEAELAHLRRDFASTDPSLSSTNAQKSSYSYAAALGTSLSRSTTPDPQHIPRAPSPCLTPIGGGRNTNSDKRSVNSPSLFNDAAPVPNESTDLVTALSGLNISKGSRDEQAPEDHNNYLFNLPGGEVNTTNQNPYLRKSDSPHFNMVSAPQSGKALYSDSGAGNSGEMNPNNASIHPDMRKIAVTSHLNLKGSPTFNGGAYGSQYQQMGSPNSSFSGGGYGLGGYSVNPMGNYNMPPLFENAAVSAMGMPGMDSRMLGGSMGSPVSDHHNLARMGANQMQPQYVDPLYLDYLRAAEYASSTPDRNYMGSGNSYDLLSLQKAYLETMLSPQKSQYNNGPFGAKANAFYGNPAAAYGYGGMSYPGSPLANQVVPNSPVGPGSPMRHTDFNMRFSGGMRNLAGPWNLNNLDTNFVSSLLEEFKSNKAKCFELSEIAGHVVEFSADQYGSRFIQQKLETATTEEKNMVYEEILPNALTLMTDVFGNYVIQKFFEHGGADQRRELAGNLFGNVLTLSLQMYGCRVIQKAIEVADVDQKIKMVEELDGHVMRCVRDQNGNHVIQKCIECVPEDHIHFIVSSFFGQVVTLSTHPYGCRVIQRVLEHCMDPDTQSKVMDEILGSVSALAQDQYGNYVVQHVLEHGKQHERSAIIQELAGRIVQMSQQKFASNVIEKCLAFGDPSERQLVVNEMLGTTDENEPLQAMMKDQFANYVVQKVLETCSDQQRELIMSRIKVHLNALKKYTYGKHIVARVEKLLAAGERRMAVQLPNPA